MKCLVLVACCFLVPLSFADVITVLPDGMHVDYQIAGTNHYEFSNGSTLDLSGLSGTALVPLGCGLTECYGQFDAFSFDLTAATGAGSSTGVGCFSAIVATYSSPWCIWVESVSDGVTTSFSIYSNELFGNLPTVIIDGSGFYPAVTVLGTNTLDGTVESGTVQMLMTMPEPATFGMVLLGLAAIKRYGWL